MIALLDYGAGNVGSVLKAVQYLGYAAQPIDRTELLPRATKIILPGQGHFGAMMRALEERSMIQSLRRMIREGIPFLGICLGLQVLYESSDEAPGCFGLGLLPGSVKRFEGVFKVPHIGWSQLKIQSDGGLFKGVADGSFDTELVREWFQAFAVNARLTLHARVEGGVNSHHVAEALFKALARALRQAIAVDPREKGRVPSTKGAL